MHSQWKPHWEVTKGSQSDTYANAEAGLVRQVLSGRFQAPEAKHRWQWAPRFSCLETATRRQCAHKCGYETWRTPSLGHAAQSSPACRITLVLLQKLTRGPQSPQTASPTVTQVDGWKAQHQDRVPHVCPHICLIITGPNQTGPGQCLCCAPWRLRDSASPANLLLPWEITYRAKLFLKKQKPSDCFLVEVIFIGDSRVIWLIKPRDEKSLNSKIFEKDKQKAPMQIKKKKVTDIWWDWSDTQGPCAYFYCAWAKPATILF